MGNYFVYSVEQLPRLDLQAKRDYNPAGDYIGFNGLYIPTVEAKTWTKLPDKMRSLRHKDRADKAGTAYHVFDDEIAMANRERLRTRGVIFIDHEPTPAERASLEKEAMAANMKFRLDCIQQYELQAEQAKLRGFLYPITSYTQECYDVLGMERPGSVEALRAQRQPGEAAAERFASAIEKLLDRLGPKEAPSAPAKKAGTSSAPAAA